MAGKRVGDIIESQRPCAVHISTEGPLGLAARRYCLRHKIPFTTAFHTRFPEYVNARFRTPVSLGYSLMRWFHGPSRGVMVATPTLFNELKDRGIGNVTRWTRGVDTALFRPVARDYLDALGLERPYFMYVGRVATEKNIDAFLRLDLPGTKFVVGDGPSLPGLAKKYPKVHFTGPKFGEELASHYAAADVFVFPSLTDTFGLVMLEALACGTPVAAFPVTGPIDVIADSGVGVLDQDLQKAALAALKIDREACRAYATQYSWPACAAQFRGSLARFDPLEISAWSLD